MHGLALDAPGVDLRGSTLTIGNWSVAGDRIEVAPLHVHHDDDEAWHVLSGALRFRFTDAELIADAGTTVIVPAGTPHTFGDAGQGPTRYLIIAPARIDALIAALHVTDRSQHPDVYRAHASELLE